MLSKEEGGRHTPFFNNYRPQFYFRTTDVTGAVELPKDKEMVMPGDNVSITVKLIAPIAMEEGLRFAIREGGTNRRRRGRGQDPGVTSEQRQGCSSIGRALVSKTRGWGFDALRPCHRAGREDSSGRAQGNCRTGGLTSRRLGESKSWRTRPHLQVETVSTGADKAKLAAAGVLVVAAVVGVLSARQAGPVAARRRAARADGRRRGDLLHLRAGQAADRLRPDSVREVKKVVWPTRKEALQMTGYVFAFVVVMALFLWLTDKTLEWVLYDLILGWKR